MPISTSENKELPGIRFYRRDHKNTIIKEQTRSNYVKTKKNVNPKWNRRFLVFDSYL